MLHTHTLGPRITHPTAQHDSKSMAAVRLSLHFYRSCFDTRQNKKIDPRTHTHTRITTNITSNLWMPVIYRTHVDVERCQWDTQKLLVGVR